MELKFCLPLPGSVPLSPGCLQFRPNPTERRHSISTIISRHKLALFSCLLKQFIRDHPGKALSAGIITALTGTGLAVAVAPLIISTGSVITASGEGLVVFGVAVSGLGLIFGCLDRSSLEVMKNLIKSGLFIAGIGTLAMASGILVSGIGYAVMLSGGVLAVAGLGVAGYAVNNILTADGEEQAFREGFETVVTNINDKHDITDLPLVVVDMDNNENQK